jgi:hypothetical protein
MGRGCSEADLIGMVILDNKRGDLQEKNPRTNCLCCWLSVYNNQIDKSFASR